MIIGSTGNHTFLIIQRNDSIPHDHPYSLVIHNACGGREGWSDIEGIHRVLHARISMSELNAMR